MRRPHAAAYARFVRQHTSMTARAAVLLMAAICAACSRQPSRVARVAVRPRPALGCFMLALAPPHLADSVPFLRAYLDLAAGPPNPAYYDRDWDPNYFGNVILIDPINRKRYRGTWRPGGDSITIGGEPGLMRLRIAGDSIAGWVSMEAFGSDGGVMRSGSLHGYRVRCAA